MKIEERGAKNDASDVFNPRILHQKCLDDHAAHAVALQKYGLILAAILQQDANNFMILHGGPSSTSRTMSVTEGLEVDHLHLEAVEGVVPSHLKKGILILTEAMDHTYRSNNIIRLPIGIDHGGQVGEWLSRSLEICQSVLAFDVSAGHFHRAQHQIASIPAFEFF